jgi:hypothetical protein
MCVPDGTDSYAVNTENQEIKENVLGNARVWRPRLEQE